MTYEESKGYALAVTQTDVDAINAALPDTVWVSPFVVGGAGYLCADLLTDCEGAGTYRAARAMIEALPVVPMPTE